MLVAKTMQQFIECLVLRQLQYFLPGCQGARVPVSLEMEEKAGNCICMALFTVLSRPQFSTSKSEWGL